MVECIPIEVLQLFCWPMTPFHRQPTLWPPTPISSGFSHVVPRIPWNPLFCQTTQSGMDHNLQRSLLCIKNEHSHNSCETLIIGVHGMHGRMHHNWGLATVLFPHDLSSSAYPMITYTHIQQLETCVIKMANKMPLKISFGQGYTCIRGWERGGGVAFLNNTPIPLQL